jgi:2-polyprenyl-3-methyl-5-hydroxy-6-metoxy-1,4-benzoquinol methylase
MNVSPTDLSAVFEMKFGDPEAVGPVHRRWLRAGYFSPNDYYEVTLDRLVTPGCRWLDVGGGTTVVPRNPKLSRRLADRCGRLVGVDPSPNIHENPYVHDRVQGFIEEYQADEPFDLLTLRMVAEHIDRPHDAMDAMARLVRPGGRVLIYTVNKFAATSVAAWVTPFRLHHPIKRLIWKSEAKDTFPVVYRMNTRRTLRTLAEAHGFTEESFARLDDCRLFFSIPVLGRLEIALWQVSRSLGIPYPESCLMGVYRRME